MSSSNREGIPRRLFSLDDSGSERELEPRRRTDEMMKNRGTNANQSQASQSALAASQASIFGALHGRSKEPSRLFPVNPEDAARDRLSKPQRSATGFMPVARAPRPFAGSDARSNAQSAFPGLSLSMECFQPETPTNNSHSESRRAKPSIRDGGALFNDSPNDGFGKKGSKWNLPPQSRSQPSGSANGYGKIGSEWNLPPQPRPQPSESAPHGKQPAAQQPRSAPSDLDKERGSSGSGHKVSFSSQISRRNIDTPKSSGGGSATSSSDFQERLKRLIPSPRRRREYTPPFGTKSSSSAASVSIDLPRRKVGQAHALPQGTVMQPLIQAPPVSDPLVQGQVPAVEAFPPMVQAREAALVRGVPVQESNQLMSPRRLLVDYGGQAHASKKRRVEEQDSAKHMTATVSSRKRARFGQSNDDLTAPPGPPHRMSAVRNDAARGAPGAPSVLPMTTNPQAVGAAASSSSLRRDTTPLLFGPSAGYHGIPRRENAATGYHDGFFQSPAAGPGFSHGLLPPPSNVAPPSSFRSPEVRRTAPVSPYPLPTPYHLRQRLLQYEANPLARSNLDAGLSSSYRSGRRRLNLASDSPPLLHGASLNRNRLPIFQEDSLTTSSDDAASHTTDRRSFAPHYGDRSSLSLTPGANPTTHLSGAATPNRRSGRLSSSAQSFRSLETPPTVGVGGERFLSPHEDGDAASFASFGTAGPRNSFASVGTAEESNSFATCATAERSAKNESRGTARSFASCESNGQSRSLASRTRRAPNHSTNRSSENHAVTEGEETATRSGRRSRDNMEERTEAEAGGEDAGDAGDAEGRQRYQRSEERRGEEYRSLERRNRQEGGDNNPSSENASDEADAAAAAATSDAVSSSPTNEGIAPTNAGSEKGTSNDDEQNAPRFTSDEDAMQDRSTEPLSAGQSGNLAALIADDNDNDNDGDDNDNDDARDNDDDDDGATEVPSACDDDTHARRTAASMDGASISSVGLSAINLREHDNLGSLPGNAHDMRPDSVNDGDAEGSACSLGSKEASMKAERDKKSEDRGFEKSNGGGGGASPSPSLPPTFPPPSPPQTIKDDVYMEPTDGDKSDEGERPAGGGNKANDTWLGNEMLHGNPVTLSTPDMDTGQPGFESMDMGVQTDDIPEPQPKPKARAKRKPKEKPKKDDHPPLQYFDFPARANGEPWRYDFGPMETWRGEGLKYGGVSNSKHIVDIGVWKCCHPDSYLEVNESRNKLILHKFGEEDKPPLGYYGTYESSLAAQFDILVHYELSDSDAPADSPPPVASAAPRHAPIANRAQERQELVARGRQRSRTLKRAPIENKAAKKTNNGRKSGGGPKAVIENKAAKKTNNGRKEGGGWAKAPIENNAPKKTNNGRKEGGGAKAVITVETPRNGRGVRRTQQKGRNNDRNKNVVGHPHEDLPKNSSLEAVVEVESGQSAGIVKKKSVEGAAAASGEKSTYMDTDEKDVFSLKRDEMTLVRVPRTRDAVLRVTSGQCRLTNNTTGIFSTAKLSDVMTLSRGETFMVTAIKSRPCKFTIVSY